MTLKKFKSAIPDKSTINTFSGIKLVKYVVFVAFLKVIDAVLSCFIPREFLKKNNDEQI